MVEDVWGLGNDKKVKTVKKIPKKSGVVVKKDEKIKSIFKSLGSITQRKGIRMGVFGKSGTGKTHFALTAPEPLFIIDTEMGVRPLAHLFKDKKVIHEEIYEEDPDTADMDAIASLKKFTKLIQQARESDAKTVIIDSISDVWLWVQEWMKIAYLEIPSSKAQSTDMKKLIKRKQAHQWDWSMANNKYRTLLLKILNLEKNVILVARAAEEYSGAGSPTGKYKPKWQKETVYMVDMMLFTSRDFNKQTMKVDFNGKIDKCRYIAKLMGRAYKNPNFDKISKDITLITGLKYD